MKKVNFSLWQRLVVVLVVFLVLVVLALWLASWLGWRTFVQVQQETPQSIDYARLEFVDGQGMSSDNFTVTTDMNQPAAMYLPLKTMTDFEATATATTATITTSKGEIIIELYPDRAPVTVTNFVKLARSGFYDRLKWHRVEPGFVIQTGDPDSRLASDSAALAKLGSGYPGYRIIDEFHPLLTHGRAGTVSMANINVNGNYPDTGGSQFFITLAPATHLDGRHAVFGQVKEGMEVVSQLEVGDEIIGIKCD